jgi:MFS family permease
MGSRIAAALRYYTGVGRDAQLLIIARAISLFPVGFVSVIETVYLTRIGYEPTAIGLLLTLSGLAGSIVTLPFGILADRYGRRRLLLLGVVATSGGLIAFVVTTEYVWLVVGGALHGVGYGMLFPAWGALLAEKTSQDKRNVAFSVSAFVQTLALTGSSFLGTLPDWLRRGYSVELGESYRFLFLVGVVITATAVLPALMIRDTAPARHPRFLPYHSWPVVRRITVVQAFIGFGAGFIIPLFPLWFFLAFRLDEAVLGPLFAVANAATAFSFLFAPRLAEALGTVRSIVTTNGMATVLLVTIPFATDYVAVAVLFVVRQFLMNMSDPILTSYTLSLVDPTERAMVAGVTAAAWSIPNAISPSLGGYFIERIYLHLPFFVCGTFYAGAVLALQRFFGRRPDSKQSESA